MEITELDPDIDKTQVPPLNQKRILAFVNHFLINTCTFLNEFALGCETKFIELERKLQKTEAALMILEAKLASIPTEETTIPVSVPELPLETETAALPDIVEPVQPIESMATVEVEVVKGVRVRDDVRYKKFFKMLHVGVPSAAVKQKMQAEGLQSELLDNPELLLTDGVSEEN